jgi:myo-inositol-1-phosphate synthase
MKKNHPAIAPSMLYAWAAITSGVPFANGAPNLTVDIPRHAGTGAKARRAHLRQGLQDRPDAAENHPRARLQGAHARHERLVLDQHSRQPRRRSARRSRVVQNQGGIETRRARIHPAAQALSPALRQLCHKVRINYYPPRGDNKEGWDNIDIFGWLGYPMQIKVDFLCRDSILAAPIVLDLVLFLDLAKRAGMHGIQEWLSFYFKSPMCAPELYPEHDLFIQSMKLKNTLRWMMGEDLITHLGSEYYD